MDIQSSHELYVILNSNGTLFVDKNRDFRLYKTKKGLEKYREKYTGKKIAIFKLSEIKQIDDLLEESENENAQLQP